MDVVEQAVCHPLHAHAPSSLLKPTCSRNIHSFPGLWAKAQSPPSNFLWGHLSSKGKLQGDHVYLLCEHVSAPRAHVLWRRDLKQWQLSGGSLPVTHQEDVCGVNAWSLHMSTCTLKPSPLDTSKSLIIELHCWNIVPKFDLM